MEQDTLVNLLNTENLQFEKLQKIVLTAIEEEKLLSEGLHDMEDRNIPASSRIADKVAAFGGSWRFIICFLLVMSAWILFNLFYVSHRFDPYPFILLNLLLSMIAALQAPVIMMSQNRKEEKDRQRSVSDYLVNLKSEIEIRNMHQKLDLLMADQMKTLFELQKFQVELMQEIKGAVDRSDKSQEQH